MMEYAEWRNHRGCMIVETRTLVFRRRRYSVWRHGLRIATCHNSVLAELHVDALIDGERLSDSRTEACV